MKITSYQIYSYTLPMLFTMKERIGLLLYLETSDGKSTWSEIAPLPSFSKEHFKDALLQLKSIKDLVLNKEWEDAQCLNTWDLFPSVSFGLESALLSFLDPVTLVSTAINGHATGSMQQMREKLNHFKKEGFSSVKIKISHLDINDAIDLIHEFKQDFKLRLDANRSFSLEHALKFFSHFSTTDFEYVEEPLNDPSLLPHFPYPFALDETLYDFQFENLLSLDFLKAIILKPTLQGGLFACQKLYERMHKRNLSITVTSTLESGVGIYQLSCLVKRMGLSHLPMGLDTLSYFGDELLQDPVISKNGELILPKNLKIKKEKLQCL